MGYSSGLLGLTMMLLAFLAPEVSTLTEYWSAKLFSTGANLTFILVIPGQHPESAGPSP